MIPDILEVIKKIKKKLSEVHKKIIESITDGAFNEIC